ncbi:MAG TPA: DUF2382 domain-containing protein, partial [Azospirillaceae bacterium]|nr:DUF2382 domain-containing protein [Azospirillaceae bacterium]
MPTTIIGLFDDADQAQKLCQTFSRGDIGARDIAQLNQDSGNIEDALSERGFEDYEIQAYAEAIGEGGTVVIAQVEDDKADQAIDLMHEHGAHEPEGLAEQEQRQQSQRQRHQESQSIKEVEEEVNVGKRQVSRGGVRARTRVVERPVEETVSLKREKVNVEHHDVDRAISPKEAEEAFKEGSIEMEETAEETEVRKAARQIGE